MTSEHANIDPVALIRRFCGQTPTAEILIAHGRQVADKALALAARQPDLGADPVFLEQAALLHDIGVVATCTPSIGCHGDLPYVCHGVAGRKMLEQIGLFAHARVCETHVGTGIRADEIRQRHLPLPVRDMLPQTIEEKLICYADKFFSKTNGAAAVEKSMASIVAGLDRYGSAQKKRFFRWAALFEPERPMRTHA